MWLGRELAVLLGVVAIGGGCANAPLRSVAVEKRAGARVVNSAAKAASEFSTANAQGMRTAGVDSGLGPALILGTSAALSERGGVSWVSEVRGRSGIDEGAILAQRVRERIRQLGSEHATETEHGPTLDVVVTEAGISELERGGFFGVTATALARLWSAEKKEIWSATAHSSSTRLRRREEYGANPALYAEDYREVADDLPRQVVQGPIR
jgi:hypothetical protein